MYLIKLQNYKCRVTKCGNSVALRYFCGSQRVTTSASASAELSFSKHSTNKISSLKITKCQVTKSGNSLALRHFCLRRRQNSLSCYSPNIPSTKAVHLSMKVISTMSRGFGQLTKCGNSLALRQCVTSAYRPRQHPLSCYSPNNLLIDAVHLSMKATAR